MHFEKTATYVIAEKTHWVPSMKLERDLSCHWLTLQIHAFHFAQEDYTVGNSNDK
jgi:hypothetical protein